MMNAVAIALLFSYLGSVVFLVPESPVSRADVGQNPGAAVLQSVKHAAQKVICEREPCSPQDGSQSTTEGIADVIQERASEIKRGMREKAEEAREKIGQKISDVRELAEERIIPSSEMDDATSEAEKWKVSQKLDEETKQQQQRRSGYGGGEDDGTESTVLYASRGSPQEGVDRRVHEIAEGASEAAQALHERVKHEAQEAASKVKEAGSSAAESLQNMEQKAKDAAKGAVGKMKEKAMDMAEEAKEATGKVQEKALEMAPDVGEKVKEMAGDVGEKVKDTAKGAMSKVQEMEMAEEEAGSMGKAKEEKAGDLEVQERMTQRFRVTKSEVDVDGDGGLVVKVQELCSWVGRSDGGKMSEGGQRPAEMHMMVDVDALKESYAHLMKSAMAAIDRSREVFEKAVESNGGGADWRENYLYLAQSAESALKAAEEMFGRASDGSAGVAAGRGGAMSWTKFLKQILAQAQQWRAKLGAVVRALYLGIFSATFGIAMWMTFLSGHILSRVLPRQQLGISQKRLSAVYLWVSAVGLMSCTAIHAWMKPWRIAEGSERWQYVNLAGAGACALMNAMVAEPRMWKEMQKRLKVEKEEGRGGGVSAGGEAAPAAAMAALEAIDGRLRRWHAFASAFNLIMMGGLMGHLWYLSNRLLLI